MKVQSSKTVDGFVMQASQTKDSWENSSGHALGGKRSDDGDAGTTDRCSGRRTVVG